jgi:hypothetical protein
MSGLAFAVPVTRQPLDLASFLTDTNEQVAPDTCHGERLPRSCLWLDDCRRVEEQPSAHVDADRGRISSGFLPATRSLVKPPHENLFVQSKAVVRVGVWIPGPFAWVMLFRCVAAGK